jgi:predicted Zn-dependent protease
MRKYLTISAIVTAAVAAGVALTMTASASTSDVLTYGSQGGSNVSVGSTLSSNLSSDTQATFYTSSNGSDGAACSSGTMSEDVTANPTAGGNATADVGSQSFGGCSNNLGYTESSAKVDSYSATVNSSGVSVGTVSATLVFTPGLEKSVTCNYTGTSLSGSNVFSNQLMVGDGLNYGSCPKDVYFSATYGTVTDTSVEGSPAVYVNS